MTETRTIHIDDIQLVLTPEGVSAFMSGLIDAGALALRELGIDMHYCMVIYPDGHPDAAWMTGNDVDLLSAREAALRLVDFVEKMLAGNPASEHRLN